jgi:hypothetical protein
MLILREEAEGASSRGSINGSKRDLFQAIVAIRIVATICQPNMSPVKGYICYDALRVTAHEGDLQDQVSKRVSRRSTSGTTVVAGGGSEECWLAAGLGKGM